MGENRVHIAAQTGIREKEEKKGAWGVGGEEEYSQQNDLRKKR